MEAIDIPRWADIGFDVDHVHPSYSARWVPCGKLEVGNGMSCFILDVNRIDCDTMNEYAFNSGMRGLGESFRY